MIQLEKYRGMKSRHTCTRCGHKGVFVRYIDERGEYLSDDCGRCNRESKCGYHKKPREWFADNPNGSRFVKSSVPIGTFSNPLPTVQNKAKSFDFIAPEHLHATLGNYDQNAFVQFLLNLFPDCGDEIQSVLNKYFIGTFENYTCFPYLDQLNRICRAKLIKFNQATGKRLKGDYDTSSLPAKLKLKENFQYKQIFFGEHLLLKYPDKPVAIVEAEKTAIIASLCFPEFVWLGSNSKTWLKPERLKRLGNRQIILCPDADGFDQWQSVAADAQRQGLNVKVSALIENHATDEQRADGYDLADYLIAETKQKNLCRNAFYSLHKSPFFSGFTDASLF
jgi:hypothetical protein